MAELFDAIGFGALNLDLIYRASDATMERIGVRAGGEIAHRDDSPEPLLAILDAEAVLLSRSGGGSAANAMVALGRTGYRVGYVGIVGEDPEGGFLLEGLEGVCIDGVRRRGRSGVCVTLVDSTSGERTLIVYPGANDTLGKEDVDRDLVARARYLHLTSFAGDAPFEAQKRLLAALPGRVKVSFDPGMLYATRGVDPLRPVIRRSAVIFPSREEVEMMTGEPWEPGCQRLRELGAGVVACTLGAEGSYILSEDGAIRAPAPRVDAVDTTGAGDVYAAGFMAGLIAERSLAECAALATEWAALSVTGVGRDDYPDASAPGAVPRDTPC